MAVKDALRALYGTMNRATQRRLKLAFVGMLVAGGLDVVGLALVLPLMQLLTNPDDRSGVVGQISDFFGDPSTSALVLIIAGAAFGAFILKGLFSLAFRWWMLGFINHNQADASANMFERYMGAPYPFHLRRNSAGLLRTLSTAMSQSYVGAVNSALVIATEAVTAASVLAVLLVARPVPAVGAAVYFGVIGFGFLRLVRRRANIAGDELMEASGASNKAALQGLGGVKEILVRRSTPFFTEAYRTAMHRSASAQRTQMFLNESPRFAIEMLFILGVAVMSVIIFSTGSTEQGAATLGLFVAAGFRLLPSLSRMMASTSGLRVASRAIGLVLEDLAEVPAAAAADGDDVPLQVKHHISLDGLRYRYPESDHDVLDGVTFDVGVGESVAIVGPSGAGKTTLVDIVLGLLEPTSGRVAIDGVDTAEVKARWQRSIGLVPQDVYLFDDSLRANIALGEHDDAVDDERLSEAVHRAQLDELMTELPDGLMTSVGERGVRLSGGQIQRIGIARALYLRPQLLVLDEATSALDNETERRITSTIESLRGEVTMIVVAHRLSTVRRCDKLIFMKDGQVDSIGTFDEVRDTNETFANLVRLGSLASLDDPIEVSS